MSILEFIGTALVVVAVWLIGSQDVRGQWLMLAAQVVWLAVAYLRGMWWLGLQSVVLAILTARAIVTWGRLPGRRA